LVAFEIVGRFLLDELQNLSDKRRNITPNMNPKISPNIEHFDRGTFILLALN
jgi:hypothetical protein